MLLAVDVGNTNVKLGVYDDRRLVASWRLTTRREQTADEYGVLTHTMLRSRGLEPAHVAEIAISSTVPAIQRTLEDMAGRYFSLSPFVVEPGVNVACPCRSIIRARSVPTASSRSWPLSSCTGRRSSSSTSGPRRPSSACRRGAFIGGAIAPGISTAAEALTARAARLFRVDLSRPPTAIGTNTVTNIQSGIVYGYAGLVDGLVARMRTEMDGAPPRVVATGGLVGLMEGLATAIDVVNPHLTLEGLRIACARARRTPPGPRRRAGRLTHG